MSTCQPACIDEMWANEPTCKTAAIDRWMDGLMQEKGWMDEWNSVSLRTCMGEQMCNYNDQQILF